MTKCGLGKWNEKFEIIIEKAINKPDGNLENWMKALSELPDIETEKGVFIKDNSCITARSTKPVSEEELLKLKSALLKLSPWRKGPFNFFGLELDAEWRADIKWNYVINGISSLKDIISCQTFPQDYDFMNQSVQYVCGMSVTPVMMAKIAEQVYLQWLKR